MPAEAGTTSGTASVRRVQPSMDELLEGIVELAQRLALEHFDGPPVDPFALAERLGIVLAPSEGPGRWSQRGKAPTIYVPEDVPRERLRFTVAHEVLELEAARLSPPLPLDRGLADRLEWVVQVGASELLMPRQWFAEAGEDAGWDLEELKELFEVSWEAAARRVPVCTRAVATVVDNGKVAVRTGSPDMSYPTGMGPEERQLVEDVYEEWPELEVRHGEGTGFRCSAWAALPERNDIRRVCLLTLPSEEW